VQIGDDLGLLLDGYFFLDDRQRWILNPEFLASRRDVLLFDDSGFARGSAEVDEIGLALRFGREFGRYGAAYLGLRRYLGDLDVTLGPPLPKISFDGAEWELSGVYDRLDNLFLPTRGLFMRLDYFDSSEELGADADFEQIRFSALGSKTFGRHNFLLTTRYNTTLDNDAPLYALFTGGGLLNMSGFEPAELSGQHFGLVGAGYRYQVVQSGLAPGYLGGTIEYGNATERRSDIFDEGILNGSLYFGYDTPLGPLYLGYGWAEDRSGLFFLQLGAALGGQSVGRR
jgi:NTE family protein